MITMIVGKTLNEQKMVVLRIAQGGSDAGLFAIDVLDNVELVYNIANLADEFEILTDIEQLILLFAVQIEWSPSTKLFEMGKLTDLALALDTVPIR